MKNFNFHEILSNSRAFLWSVAGFTFFAIACYPGFMSIDSLDQYMQAHTLRFADQHPPVMAWLWSKLIWILDGPQSLLFVHLGMLWVGLYIWCRNAGESRSAKWFIVLGYLPWVANFAGVLWKDMGMAFSLMLAVGLLSMERLTKPVIAAALIFLMYGFMVRTNAPAALIPIIWYASEKLFPELSNRVKLAITVLSLIFMFIFTNFFNYHLLGAQKNHIVTFMMIDDLVHFSVIEDKSLLPRVEFKTVKECSEKIVGETKLVGRMFCLVTKSSYQNVAPIPYEEIKEAWVSAVARNPLECVKLRLAEYRYLLREPAVGPYIYTYSGISPNEMGLVQNNNIATTYLKVYIAVAAHLIPFVFKPYWWLIVALLFLGATLFMRGDKKALTLVRVLLISALLYMLGYIPLAPMADFRYVYWSTLAISLAAIKFATSNIYVEIPLWNMKAKL
jgi:hypothetical protein